MTYLPKWISFVVMEPSLHAHNRYTLKVTEDHLSKMSLDGRAWKMRDILIRKDFLLSERVGDRTCGKTKIEKLFFMNE